MLLTMKLPHNKLEVSFNLEVSFLDKHNKVYSTLGVIDYDEHFLLLCRFHMYSTTVSFSECRFVC
jgi:hypothetical protein